MSKNDIFNLNLIMKSRFWKKGLFDTIIFKLIKAPFCYFRNVIVVFRPCCHWLIFQEVNSIFIQSQSFELTETLLLLVQIVTKEGLYLKKGCGWLRTKSAPWNQRLHLLQLHLILNFLNKALIWRCERRFQIFLYSLLSFFY